MTDFWQAHLEETAEYLVELHGVEGFREHAEHRANELAQNRLYETLPALIRAVRKKREGIE
jgi:hypothetical protein